MHDTGTRTLLPARRLAAALPALLAPVSIAALAGCASGSNRAADAAVAHGPRIQYLEIVTLDVDAVCAAYAAANGLTFGAPVAELGNARTAPLPDGGVVGVRAPMRSDEQPVVRPYWLVDDIEAAVAAVQARGAVIAHPPLLLPGHGTFAIYLEGDVQHGLWQL